MTNTELLEAIATNRTIDPDLATPADDARLRDLLAAVAARGL